MVGRLSMHGMMAALVLMASGCAPAVHRAFERNPNAVRQETEVRVDNRNWADVTVYLLQGEMRARLGSVTSMGSQTFSIPAAMLSGTSDVRLYIQALGSRANHRTDRIMLTPGQTVELTIENNMNLTSWAVW